MIVKVASTSYFVDKVIVCGDTAVYELIVLGPVSKY